jgi:hypothetical protein
MASSRSLSGWPTVLEVDQNKSAQPFHPKPEAHCDPKEPEHGSSSFGSQ